MWVRAHWMLPELLKERWSARKQVSLARNVAQQLQETYPVKKSSIYEVNVNFGDLTLVYTSKFFPPFSNTFDSSVKFVGPSILPRTKPPDFPFANLTVRT